MVAITATSLGYRGSIDETSGARFFNHVGAARFGVETRTHFVTTVVTGDRMVRVSAGTAWGNNIVDQMSTDATVQFDPVVSGQRWDMIVLRRDPSTSTTTMEVINGTATKALPSRPASSHTDQPISLCRVVAGQTTVQEIVDLRVFASNGGATARDTMVLGYLGQPGASVEIDGTLWVCRLTSAGAGTEWVPLAGATTFHTLSLTGSDWRHSGGLSVTRLPGGVRRVDVGVNIRLQGATRTYNRNVLNKWSQILPVEAMGVPIGVTPQVIRGYAPHYHSPNETDLAVAQLVYELDPNEGSAGFGLADATQDFTWVQNRSIDIHANYFVR